MMDDTLISALINWGMTNYEAKVYLAALELGSSPASTIARRAGLKRVTGYAILRDFVTKDIASKIIKSGVSHFHVIDPKKLLGKIQSKAEAFQQFVPQLLAMTDTYNNKPKIEYFEGINGIKEMYDDIITSETDVSAFLSTDVIHPEIKEYLNTKHIPERIEKGIFAKVIVNDSHSNQGYKQSDVDQLRETLVLATDIAEFANEIDIYGPNKVMLSMYSNDELFGMIIHSKKLHDTMRSIFNLIWQSYS